MNLTEGILRLRFRDSFEDPTPLEPHHVYRVVVRAPDTANPFAAGHCIRVDIASSNFPRFDINPNTGDKVSDERRRVVAETTVHMGAETPSALVMDVLPSTTGRKACRRPR